MLFLLTSFLIASTVIVAGMVVVAKTQKNLNWERLQILIALAAGFMIGVLFLELLPEAVTEFSGGPKVFFQGGLLGIAFVILLERYAVPRLKFLDQFFPNRNAPENEDHSGCHPKHHDQHHDHDPKNHDHHEHFPPQHLHHHHDPLHAAQACSAVACFILCSFFDGVALASVESVNQHLGALMIIGVVLHLLPEGILSGMLALAGGATPKAAKKVLFFIGGAFLLGSILPLSFREHHDSILAFASGIIIYVTFVQLLPASLRVKHAPLWIVAGVLLFVGSHALLEKIA